MPDAGLCHAPGPTAGPGASGAVFPRCRFSDALGRIGIHSNDNTAAVWLQAEALLGLLRDFGTPVVVANFSAPAAE